MLRFEHIPFSHLGSVFCFFFFFFLNVKFNCLFIIVLQLHAANVGIQTEKLENLRISIAKGSPMWETLDLSLNVVDTKSLDQLVPRLAQLVRSGVGLNTR